MRIYDVIEKKKHGGELSKEEIFETVYRYTAGELPDYQMSALMMAIWFCGMSDRETFDLTEAMATSGETVDLSAFGDRTVDKHSTGGVGDKTTLIVAPIVAAAGGTVAKMSGRGLGHTGGTVDKLESFPEFRTSLSPAEFVKQVHAHGIAVIGQSADLAPADKKLYALRDVTATVDSIPLIASSIMSKKLAAGTRSIVLDVKCGNGAFMRTPKDAKQLAETMVRIGTAHGRRTAAVISNMDIPLGHAVGNTLEIMEAVEVLQGGGPKDLRTVCLTLASLMIELSCQKSADEASVLAQEMLSSGKAYQKFCEWIAAQGGDASYAKDPTRFGMATCRLDIIAESDGYVAACNAATVGTAAMMLGAGRQTKEDVIDHRAGILLFKKPSDHVVRGETIATLYAERQELLSPAATLIKQALTYSPTPILTPQTVYETVTAEKI